VLRHDLISTIASITIEPSEIIDKLQKEMLVTAKVFTKTTTYIRVMLDKSTLF